MGATQRRLLLLGGDVLILYASLVLALNLRLLGAVPLEFLWQNVAAFSSIFPVWFLVFYVFELYDLLRTQDLIALIGNVALALGVNLWLSIALFYLFSIHLGMTPKTNLLLTVILAHVGIFVWRHLLLRLLLPRLPSLRVAFWGDSPLFEEMAEDIKRKPYLGYAAVPFPKTFPSLASEALERSWLSPPQPTLALKAFVDVIVVDPDRLEADPALGHRLMSTALSEEVPIRTPLDFYEEVNLQVPPSHAAKSGWVISHVLQRRNSAYILTFKRLIDAAAALLGLILLSPALLLIAAVSALLDGEAPLYRQRRVGRLGREFMIWKFRTMAPDAEARGPLSKAGGRVTRFGAFLRRFRLDELPQLWNVLKGEMSLVGPRPEWVSEASLLEQSVPHYHLRHLVKPGITGWAQVHFRATSNPDDSFEKLHFDLYYVKNVSLALDAGIILKTFKRVLREETSFTNGKKRVRR